MAIKTKNLLLQLFRECDACGKEYGDTIPYNPNSPPDLEQPTDLAAYVEIDLGDDQTFKVEMNDLCVRCRKNLKRVIQNFFNKRAIAKREAARVDNSGVVEA
ncbi:hypothetical protein LCGC14_0144870 [marine sediment metagenome]|uniref:Uncharacterized protein n=1 Tax=marine sediment metagenome TaxID=412755 RepID=A0A0F9UZM9_9ZZZZ